MKSHFHCLFRKEVRHIMEVSHSPLIINWFAGSIFYIKISHFLSVGLYYEPQGEPVFVFEGQQGGVSHIAFSPDGTKLYSGGRKVRFLI